MNTTMTEIKLGSLVRIRMNGRVGNVRGVYQSVANGPQYEVVYADANEQILSGWFRPDEVIAGAAGPDLGPVSKS